jgi:uncharacterized protein (TIGR02145 family)
MNYWNGSSWVVVPPGNYGQLLSFCNGVPTWGGCLPIVTTTAASAITANGATTGGNVTSDGGLVVTARGVVYGTSPNPTIQGASTSNGTGTGAFTSQLTGLTASTNYYVRAYATNSVGTAYGNEATFFTGAFITIVFSVDMSQYVGSINNVHMAGNFSDLGASVNGNPIGNWHDFVPMVNTSGNIYSVSVQFPLTSQGLNFEWKFINGSGWNYPHEIFNSSYQCTALDPQGVYYNRQITTQTNISYLYCYNSCFVCTPSFALVTTTSASFITTSAATTGGNVTSDGGAAVMARGVAYGTSVNPTTSGTITNNGTGTGVFTSQLSGLTPSTAYFARAYAINSVGTAYGNEVTFTTLSTIPSFTCGTTTVTDVDGNSYATVQIGTQCWTQSNLTVSKYRDGSSIPNITDNTQWSQTNTSSTGAWCNYNNNASNGTTYGKMYNWYAVNDSRGLCPTGWHVPTDAEWTTLTTHLGGTLVAVGAMKSTTGWNSPNTGATNLSGFTGLPGGYRSNIGGFYNVGNYGYWWSSSGAGSGHAWYRDLYYNDASVYRGNGDRRGGFSVRCVRD